METSIGPEVPAEEVVENKTVRVDNVELPPETPGAQVVCQGCKRVGHIASLCPLTNCQQWKLQKWTEQGNDPLSTSSDEPAQSLPTPPAESTPTPASRALAPGHPNPTPMAIRTDGKAAAKPLQPAETLSTKQRQTPNDKGTTSADRLLSSIGARTRAKTGETPQPVVGATPLKERTEKALNK